MTLLDLCFCCLRNHYQYQ